MKGWIATRSVVPGKDNSAYLWVVGLVSQLGILCHSMSGRMPSGARLMLLWRRFRDFASAAAHCGPPRGAQRSHHCLSPMAQMPEFRQ